MSTHTRAAAFAAVVAIVALAGCGEPDKPATSSPEEPAAEAAPPPASASPVVAPPGQAAENGAQHRIREINTNVADAMQPCNSAQRTVLEALQGSEGDAVVDEADNAAVQCNEAALILRHQDVSGLPPEIGRQLERIAAGFGTVADGFRDLSKAARPVNKALAQRGMALYSKGARQISAATAAYFDAVRAAGVTPNTG